MPWNGIHVPATVSSITRLLDRVARSDKDLKKPIERADELEQEFGGRYGWRDDNKPRPMNLIHRGITTLLATLVARAAQHDVQAKTASARAAALVWNARLDHLYREQNRTALMREALFEALIFPVSVRRTGVRWKEAMANVSGQLADPAEFYCRTIYRQDWVVDTLARDWRERAFEGDRYRVSKRMCLESGHYQGFEDFINALPAAYDSAKERFGGSGINSEGVTGDDADDLIELMDLFVFGDDQITQMTLPSHPETAKAMLEQYKRPLLEREYEGRRGNDGGGPYRHLCFYPVKGRILPASVAAPWREQSEAFTALVNKQVEEWKRTRKIPYGQKTANLDDGKTINAAKDSEFLLLDHPQGINTMELGGDIPGIIQGAMMFLGFFNTQAGNPDILGGGSGGAKQATIYAGQQASASSIVEDLLATSEQCEAEISADALWWERYAPVQQRVVTLTSPTGQQYTSSFSPEEMDADDMDYDVKIKPRSTTRIDQMTRASAVTKLMPTIAEAAQVEVLTNGLLKAREVARIIGREIGVDDLSEVIGDQAIQMREDIAMAGATPGQLPASGRRFGQPRVAGFGRTGGGGAAVGAAREMAGGLA